MVPKCPKDVKFTYWNHGFSGLNIAAGLRTASQRSGPRRTNGRSVGHNLEEKNLEENLDLHCLVFSLCSNSSDSSNAIQVRGNRYFAFKDHVQAFQFHVCKPARWGVKLVIPKVTRVALFKIRALLPTLLPLGPLRPPSVGDKRRNHQPSDQNVGWNVVYRKVFNLLVKTGDMSSKYMWYPSEIQYVKMCQDMWPTCFFSRDHSTSPVRFDHAWRLDFSWAAMDA